MITKEPPFTTTELSEWLWSQYRIKRSKARLAKLRQIGGGPSYVRDGVMVRYRREDARKWAERQLGQTAVASTSEESARFAIKEARKEQRVRVSTNS